MFDFLKRYLCRWHHIYRQHHQMATQTGLSSELSHYFQTPLPSPDALVFQVEMVAFDFETSGLNPETDQILSIGWVPMTLDQIDVDASAEVFIRHPEYVNAQSAMINQIVPDTLENGLEIHEAMAALFQQLAGKIAVVHGSVVERQFVEMYAKKHLGLSSFPCLWIDTLKIEKHLTFDGKMKKGISLQLNDVRERYGLPTYRAHSAGIDALSTAELFTAQMKSIFKNHPPKLSKLVESCL